MDGHEEATSLEDSYVFLWYFAYHTTETVDIVIFPVCVPATRWPSWVGFTADSTDVA